VRPGGATMLRLFFFPPSLLASECFFPHFRPRLTLARIHTSTLRELVISKEALLAFLAHAGRDPNLTLQISNTSQTLHTRVKMPT
jgi:hypothetical protein